MINKEAQMAMDRINAKPLSKKKGKRFFQKIGNFFKKAGVRIKQGFRHAKEFLNNNPVGNFLKKAGRTALGSIPHPAAQAAGLAMDIAFGK